MTRTKRTHLVLALVALAALCLVAGCDTTSGGHGLSGGLVRPSNCGCR